MKKTLMLILATVFALINATAAMAGGGHICLYANDDVEEGPTNTVDGYLVTTTFPYGTYLNPVPTGGSGSGQYYGSQLASARSSRETLYVSDGGTGDIALFSIDHVTCQLTHIGNYPSGAGGLGDIGIAISPNGQSLYAANTNDKTLRVMKIYQDGSLAPPSQLIVEPADPIAMSVSRNNSSLIVSLAGNQVISYSRDLTNGRLHFVSSVSTPGAALGLVVDSNSTFVYIGEFNQTATEVAVLKIGAGSTLAYISDNTFDQGGQGSDWVLLFGHYLYVSNQGSAQVTTLRVNGATGRLTFVTTSADGVAGTDAPGNIVANSPGTVLFTGDIEGNLMPSAGLLKARPDGSLALIASLPLSFGTNPFSLAAVSCPASECP